MRRRGTGTALAALLALAGVWGLSGCGGGPGGAAVEGPADGAARGAAEQVAVDVAAAMGADGQALAAMGFDLADIDAAGMAADPDGAPAGDPAAVPAAAATTATPATSATPSSAPGETAAPDRRGGKRGEGWRKRHQARVLLRRNTLHGEVVVQTRDGTRTVAVQRGTVTAVDGDSITVRSADGFTMTWRFGEKLRVVERRTTVQPQEVAVGTEIGVSGTKDGDRGVARLIVIPRRK